VTITVTSTPSGASVLRAADGVRLGATPLAYRTEAGPGEVELVLQGSGHDTARRRIRTDRDDTVHVSLVKKPARSRRAPHPDAGVAETPQDLLDDRQ
jgi:hypothetical protein